MIYTSNIVKTKFLCKSGCKIAPFRGYSGTQKLNWTDLFIEGKWYDGEYETWSQELYKLNNGWRRYWVINEKGEKEEMNRIRMSTIFQLDVEELRDEKINQIIGDADRKEER